MDIENYIASGILESYALGLCSKEETAEVEKLCAQNPSVKKELEGIQDALNAYALLHASAPKEETRTAIFNTIDQLNDRPEQNIKIHHQEKQAPVIALQKPGGLKFYLAAAVALFVMSLVINIVLFLKWQNTESALTALNAEQTLLTENLKSNQVKLDRMSGEMALMGSPATQKVMLKAVEKHPGMLATVYWNKESKEVYLEVKVLPMPDAGKQYQLWAIVDGKPVDAGMINMEPGDSSLHKMKDFESAQAFAITLEKAGGSPAPDLEQLFVIGNIGS